MCTYNWISEMKINHPNNRTPQRNFLKSAQHRTPIYCRAVLDKLSETPLQTVFPASSTSVKRKDNREYVSSIDGTVTTDTLELSHQQNYYSSIMSHAYGSYSGLLLHCINNVCKFL